MRNGEVLISIFHGARAKNVCTEKWLWYTVGTKEEQEMEWYVYMLHCCDGTLYTGSTNRLEQRVLAHAKGGEPSTPAAAVR